MTETMDDAAFWLPPHFLTDDDFLVDARPVPGDPINTGVLPAALDLHLYRSRSSAIDSPVSSTETEHDRDELLVELTRQLASSSLLDTTNNFIPGCSQTLTLTPDACAEKLQPPLVLATSPQSTLSGFGSWANPKGNVSPIGPSRVPSRSPTPPPDYWDLMYAAAEQVAVMKMDPGTAQLNHPNGGLPASSAFSIHRNVSNSVFGGERSDPPVSSFYFSPNNQLQRVVHDDMNHGLVGHCQLHRKQTLSRGRCYYGGCCGGAIGLPPSAWPPLGALQQQQQPHGPQQNHNYPHILSGCGGMKRQSAGTGVFLPRRYGTTPAAVSRKKPAGCPTVLLPSSVVQALNLNMEETHMGHPRPQPPQSLVSDRDEVVMGRGNAAAAAAAVWAAQQQRRSMMMMMMMKATMVRGGGQGPLSYEISLPQEWSY